MPMMANGDHAGIEICQSSNATMPSASDSSTTTTRNHLSGTFWVDAHQARVRVVVRFRRWTGYAAGLATHMSAADFFSASQCCIVTLKSVTGCQANQAARGRRRRQPRRREDRTRGRASMLMPLSHSLRIIEPFVLDAHGVIVACRYDLVEHVDDIGLRRSMVLFRPASRSRQQILVGISGAVCAAVVLHLLSTSRLDARSRAQV